RHPTPRAHGLELPDLVRCSAGEAGGARQVWFQHWRSNTTAMVIPYPPIDPPPVAVRFPEPRRGEDVIAVSRSLSPALVLEAYKSGIFPWPVRQGLVPWASPDPRAIFPLERPKPWPRTVRRALKGNFRIS